MYGGVHCHSSEDSVVKGGVVSSALPSQVENLEWALVK